MTLKSAMSTLMAFSEVCIKVYVKYETITHFVHRSMLFMTTGEKKYSFFLNVIITGVHL